MNGLIGFLLCTLLTCQGCSIFCAANAPEPIHVEQLQTGKDRNSIISILGMPNSTESLNNERTDTHEFTSGYDPATKFRILVYLAGDVFTLGFAELVFWPLEVMALQGDEGRAVITYDQGDIAKTVIVTNKGGGPWKRRTSTEKETGSDPDIENMNAYEYRHGVKSTLPDDNQVAQ
jgi:hypothetical protein